VLCDMQTLTHCCTSRPDCDALPACSHSYKINYNLYQNRIIVIPALSACGWGGLGMVGCGAYCYTWIKVRQREGGGTWRGAALLQGILVRCLSSVSERLLMLQGCKQVCMCWWDKSPHIRSAPAGVSAVSLVGLP
jgi:hypothetical protein